MKNLKYLIVGSGGTGGALGAHLAKAGFDVTFIARGDHLKAMQERGLHIIRSHDDFTIYPIQATDTAHYNGTPDVIFVCVKGYSIANILPFLQRVATSNTAIIPILNIYGTGGAIQPKLPGVLVTDGCIYVAAAKTAPAEITMSGDILRVVFGVRHPEDDRPVLKQIAQDLNQSDVQGILSDNIQRDALLKFSYVSPQSACGLYYDVAAGAMQQPGKYRDFFAQLVHEIDTLAEAMGIHFEEDIVARNLKILDDLAPDMTTSMQKDIAAGKPSEIDGQIYEVVRLSKKYGITLPAYEKVAAKAKVTGLQ